jgi:hypothetical protein
MFFRMVDPQATNARGRPDIEPRIACLLTMGQRPVVDSRATRRDLPEPLALGQHQISLVAAVGDCRLNRWRRSNTAADSSTTNLDDRSGSRRNRSTRVG